MKIYYDLVFVLNLGFDFLLLLSTSLILKRNVRLRRIFLGSLLGSLSIFFLFIDINSFLLLIFKVVISIFMILVTFSFKNFKYFINNFLYLYLVSIVLGGGLYLVNDSFSYKQVGLIFINNGVSINFLILVVLTPIILYIYLKLTNKLKLNYNNYYQVSVYYQDKKYNYTGYLDSGNKLYDQYKKRPIIIADNSCGKIKFNYDEGILVSYETASGVSILKCIVASKVEVDGKEFFDVVVGLLDSSFKIDGVDLILHCKLMGGLI